MSDFTTAGSAKGPLFSGAEWREVVVKQELLVLPNKRPIDELFVELGAQGQRGQALGFSTCEDG